MFRELLQRETFHRADVFDVGTGPGTIAFLVAPRARSVLGVDRNEHALWKAREYAAIKGIRHVDFALGDVESTSWHVWHPEPFDVVTTNLCMSEAVVFRATRALRPGGRLLFCCHEAENWVETGERSSYAFAPEEMQDLLETEGFGVTFLGVDREVVEFDGIEQVERFLRADLVRKWVSDGRWEGLRDTFDRGRRTLTLSFLVGRAVKERQPAEA